MHRPQPSTFTSTYYVLPLHMCLYTTICVLMPPPMSRPHLAPLHLPTTCYHYICVRIPLYVSSYHYLCLAHILHFYTWEYQFKALTFHTTHIPQPRPPPQVPASKKKNHSTKWVMSLNTLKLKHESQDLDGCLLLSLALLLLLVALVVSKALKQRAQRQCFSLSNEKE